MKDFAKFDEIPSMTLQDIKKTKRYGHTFVRLFVRSFGRTDNVKTVYPPTNTVCWGYNNYSMQCRSSKKGSWCVLEEWTTSLCKVSYSQPSLLQRNVL